MPDYVPSYVNETYGLSAHFPTLDRVVFTIDHIHMGGPGIYSTFDIVKYLVNHKIPVVIFMECTDPANQCKKDMVHAKEIYELDPELITLGVHALPKGNTQEAQTARQRLINNVIKDITGSESLLLSYHGAGAGPELGVIFENIKYARGIRSWVAAQRFNRLDTPVMSLSSIRAAFKYTKLRNKAGLSATLFVHSVELRSSYPQKKVFDAFIKQVTEQSLQALPYSKAMELDYSDARCPLKIFTKSFLSQNLYLGHVDGSGVVFQVEELQTFLNSLGYNVGDTDGFYGIKTSMAVLMYQVENDLEGDGQIGERTRTSINAFCD